MTVCDALRDARYAVTSHCGYHVHIDCRDFASRPVAYIRLLRLLRASEAWSLATQPPSRLASTTCEPWLRAGWTPPQKGVPPRVSAAECLLALYRSTPRNSDFATRYHSTRYRAINLHSLMYRGTVEIRAHSGTGNATKVIAWAETWRRLVDAARMMSTRQVARLCAPTEAAVANGAPDSAQAITWQRAIANTLSPRWGEHFAARLKRFGADSDLLGAADPDPALAAVGER
jgi:hypothetical protein